tara:strand:+ start:13758 stop:14372 length:615 start_codon:yes stop_codon:yes gene_type:complete
MPGIKTTIYDACVMVNNTTFDLRGPAAKVGITANGPVSKGQKTIRVNGTDATGLDVGDKLVSGLTGNAIGIVESTTTNSITLVRGSLTSLINDDTIELAPRFEIVAIMPLGKTASDLNESSTELTVLIPVNRNWIGTLAPNGGTYSDFDDAVTRFGAGSETTKPLIASQCFPSGTLIEGRWKACGVGANEFAMLYLKASPSQTF